MRQRASASARPKVRKGLDLQRPRAPPAEGQREVCCPRRAGDQAAPQELIERSKTLRGSLVPDRLPQSDPASVVGAFGRKIWGTEA